MNRQILKIQQFSYNKFHKYYVSPYNCKQFIYTIPIFLSYFKFQPQRKKYTKGMSVLKLKNGVVK